MDTRKNTATRDMTRKSMVTMATTTMATATALMAVVEAPPANRARAPLASQARDLPERAARDPLASQARDLRERAARGPLASQARDLRASPARDPVVILTWVGPEAVAESQRTMDTAMAMVDTVRVVVCT
jgi:hypothetical protein